MTCEHATWFSRDLREAFLLPRGQLHLQLHPEVQEPPFSHNRSRDRAGPLRRAIRHRAGRIPLRDAITARASTQRGLVQFHAPARWTPTLSGE